MSGDVQPRKRKDKKRKKDEEQTSIPAAHLFPKEPTPDDVNIHVYKDEGTGGGICAKIVFFILFSALIVLIGLIITEHRGLSDLDVVESDSKYSQIFEGWIEKEKSHDDHHTLDDHDSEHFEDEPDEEGDHTLDDHDNEYIEEEEETAEHSDEHTLDDHDSQNFDSEDEKIEDNEESQQDDEKSASRYEKDTEEEDEDDEEAAADSRGREDDEDDSASIYVRTRSEPDDSQNNENQSEAPEEDDEQFYQEDADDNSNIDNLDDTKEEEEADSLEGSKGQDDDDDVDEHDGHNDEIDRDTENEIGSPEEDSPEKEVEDKDTEEKDQILDEDNDSVERDQDDDEGIKEASSENAENLANGPELKEKVDDNPVEEPTATDENNPGSLGVIIKTIIGAAIIVVGYLNLIKKWKSDSSADEPVDKEEIHIDLSRRKTLIPPPPLKEIEKEVEYGNEEYSNEEDESDNGADVVIVTDIAKKNYNELRSSYSRSISPESDIGDEQNDEESDIDIEHIEDVGEEVEEEEEEEVEEEDIDDEEEDYENEEYDDDDEDLMKKLEAKYGKLKTPNKDRSPTPESEEPESDKLSDDNNEYEFSSLTNQDDWPIRTELDEAQKNLPEE